MRILSPLALSFSLLLALHGLQTLATPSLYHPSVHIIDERSLASNLLKTIESKATCNSCDVILTTLKGLAYFGDSTFVSVLTELCNLFKVEDPDVCKGTVASEGPILAYDLRRLESGSHTSRLLCVTFLGLCVYPEVVPYRVPFPSAKPATSRPPPSEKAPIQVVHISDTHVDPDYVVGASTKCTKPICCRPYTSAEAPGNNGNPAGPFGDHNCDPPITLEQSMINAIQAIKPAFTIFTGDVVAHDIWLVNEPRVVTDLNATFSTFAALDLVYPAVGNHDNAPVNAFPPKGLPVSPSSQPAYDAMSTDWHSWIGDAGSKSTDDYGSYSVRYAGGNLRMISFNSIFYYSLNFWLYQEPMQEDPSGQFAWLVNELQSAEDAGERAWLISHVPPGSSDFLHDYSNCFNQIIQRYEATISATFYGHTHLDEFEVAYSDYSKRSFDSAIAMSYIAPSMTPTSGPPSFRVYSVDPETFGILDFTDYTADIYSGTSPTWTKYYSAKEAYGSLLSPPITDPSAELTPAFWHNVTVLFESNDAVFQQFIIRKSRGYNTTTCTGNCKTDELCALRAADSTYNCAKFKPGSIHLSKRDDVHEQHRAHCEGSIFPSIFAEISQDQETFASFVEERVAARRRT